MIVSCSPLSTKVSFMKFFLAVLLATNLIVSSRSTNKTCSLPWHTVDPFTGDCVCYNSSDVDVVKCSDTHIDVLFGNCLTVDENYTYLGPCLNNYPSVVYPNVDKTDKRYIRLPTHANITTINTEMCDILHRTGPACSQCKEGYGPSALQAGFECAKCEWYGVLVYLLLEFGPLTLLFVILLVFPISLASAPMSSFVVLCQVVSTILTYDSTVSKVVISSGQVQSIIFYTLLTLSNIWNLDFTTYLVFIPPMCLSSKLTNIHVVLLKYLSAAYPLLLVVITYICVQLHARGNMIMVTLWRPLHRCFTRIKHAWDPKKSLVDVFASFILLSYSKLFLLFFFSIAPSYIKRVSFHEEGTLQSFRVLRFDTTLTYFSAEHIPIMIFSITVFCLLTILPVLLLCCYPTKCFRKCLHSCKLTKNQVALTTFIEKFQGDCHDGLNNSYDLRSFSSMPMVILAGAYISSFLFDLYTAWIIYTVWLLVTLLAVLMVRPYKKAYKNTMSGLILSPLVIYALLYNDFLNNINNQSGSNVRPWTIWIALLLLGVPQVTFYLYLLYYPIKKSRCFQKLQNCANKPSTQEAAKEEREDDEEPHRLQSPNEYSPLLNHSYLWLDDGGKSLTNRDTY